MVTKARTLNGVDVISNADFTSASGKMIAYNQNQQFIDQMSETKYLPSGTVRLIVKAYLACGNFSASSDSPLEIGGDCQEPLDIYETTQTNNVVSEIVLSDPSNGSDIASSRPILKWDSPQSFL